MHTTYLAPTLEPVHMLDETKYPTLFRLVELVQAARPNSQAKMYQTHIRIPASWDNQLKVLECLLYQLTDEDLAALAMLRGFEKYVATVHASHLYLVEAFINELPV